MLQHLWTKAGWADSSSNWSSVSIGIWDRVYNTGDAARVDGSNGGWKDRDRQ